MSVRREEKWERPLSVQPLKVRVVHYLRKRKASGLDEWADLDMIQVAVRADRQDVTSALAHLVERSRIERDPGPRDLAAAGRPTRWKIA